MNAVTNPKPTLSLKTLVQMLVGAAVGGAAAWFYMENADVLRWADAIALGLALVCFIAALRIFLHARSSKLLGELMSQLSQLEGDSTTREMRQARLQALMLAALGVALVWPPIATMQHWPAPWWAYGVIAAIVAAKLWYTNYVFREGDEFTRQSIRDAAWRSYFITQTLLLAYAGAERLGLVAPVNAWDILVLMTGVSILMPAFKTKRKIAI